MFKPGHVELNKQRGGDGWKIFPSVHICCLLKPITYRILANILPFPKNFVNVLPRQNPFIVSQKPTAFPFTVPFTRPFSSLFFSVIRYTGLLQENNSSMLTLKQMAPVLVSSLTHVRNRMSLCTRPLPFCPMQYSHFFHSSIPPHQLSIPPNYHLVLPKRPQHLPYRSPRPSSLPAPPYAINKPRIFSVFWHDCGHQVA